MARLLMRALALCVLLRGDLANARNRPRKGREQPQDDPDSRYAALEARPLEQCSVQLDECRSFVREKIGDGHDPVAAGGGGSSGYGMVDPASFVALTRAATDAANSSAGESIRRAPHLAAEYEKNGQVTLRSVWPRSVALLAYEELEEVWEHYRLPATFTGTAFIRAEADNPRIEGTQVTVNRTLALAR